MSQSLPATTVALRGCGGYVPALLVLVSLGSGCGDSAASDASLDSGVGDGGSDVGACVRPSLPEGDGALVLVASGAPLSLFGEEDAPTFDAAFESLAAAGFGGFFPDFGTPEVEGEAGVSGHFEYWVPLGYSATPRNCGVNNPYVAADGRVEILFPARLFSDAVVPDAFSHDEFRNRYNDFRNDCWGGEETGILGYQSLNEPATQWAVRDFVGQPLPRLENAPEAAALLHELGDAPVYLVEGPLPFIAEVNGGLTVAQREMLVSAFWTAVDQTVPGSDVFGFTVYPIPNRPPAVSADYIALSEERAPTAERLAVLQAFSTDAQTGRTDRRRGPNQLESRMMAFDAIAAGATHLIWHGASVLEPDTNEEDRQVWEGVTHTVGIVSALNSALALEPATVSATAGVTTITRQLPGGLLVVALNRSPDDVTTTLTFPEAQGEVFDWETGDALSTEPTNETDLSLGFFELRVLMTRTCTE